MAEKKLKEKLISFRVTLEDEQEILEKAKEAKMTVSSFCRRKSKGVIVKAPRPLPAIADKELVAFAKEIACNLKVLHENGQGIDEGTYLKVHELIDRVSTRINNVSNL